MAPIRGNKRMKMEKSNAGHEAFVVWWAEFSRRIAGLFSSPRDIFELFFKMSKITFIYICSLLMEPMSSKPQNYFFLDGNVMSLHDKVAIAVRRLKSGDSLVVIGDQIGVHRITVSKVTWSLVEALEHNGLRHLHWPATEKEMSDRKAKFESIQGLPNCCGAIDITHIKMKSYSFTLDTEMWLDKMNNQSMMLQAIVDPDMRFRDVFSGFPGEMTESSVLGSSAFFEICEKGNRLNGNKIKLSDGTELNEYLVGDLGFPSLQWLVTPYQGDEISERRAEFNKRHHETWNVAPMALTRLKSEWKVLQGDVWRPDIHKLPRIILACCILYNIVIDKKDATHNVLCLSDEHDPGYPLEVSKSGKKASKELRKNLSLYLSGKLEPQVGRASEYQIG